MQSKAKTVDAYLKELPPDRREALSQLREVINKNLPKGYEEGMQWGMPAWYIPLSIYPDGYHCQPDQPLPFASMASQKQSMSFYGMALYTDPEQAAWFVKEWKKTGKKLDMGKSCVRFKKIEGVPLEVIAKAVKRIKMKDYIAGYEAGLAESKSGKKVGAKRSAARKKAVAKKKAAPKKAAKKKAKKAKGKKAKSKAKAKSKSKTATKTKSAAEDA